MDCCVFGSEPCASVYAIRFWSGDHAYHVVRTRSMRLTIRRVRRSRIARSANNRSAGEFDCAAGESEVLAPSMFARRTNTDGVSAGVGEKRRGAAESGTSAFASAALIPAGRILQRTRWLSADQRTSSNPNNGRTTTPGTRSALPVAFSHTHKPASPLFEQRARCNSSGASQHAA
jgi:hypothetical protein